MASKRLKKWNLSEKEVASANEENVQDSEQEKNEEQKPSEGKLNVGKDAEEEQKALQEEREQDRIRVEQMVDAEAEEQQQSLAQELKEEIASEQSRQKDMNTLEQNRKKDVDTAYSLYGEQTTVKQIERSYQGLRERLDPHLSGISGEMSVAIDNLLMDRSKDEQDSQQVSDDVSLSKVQLSDGRTRVVSSQTADALHGFKEPSEGEDREALQPEERKMRNCLERTYQKTAVQTEHGANRPSIAEEWVPEVRQDFEQEKRERRMPLSGTFVQQEAVLENGRPLPTVASKQAEDQKVQEDELSY